MRLSKKKQFKQKREERMVQVTDDWYPCYPNNEVCLSICLGELKPYLKAPENKRIYTVHLSAWGMDDTGMELDYNSPGHRGCAESVYNLWKKNIFDKVPDGVDRQWFYEHGFWDA